MRWRAVAIVSLCLNAALLIAWLSSRDQPAARDPQSSSPSTVSTTTTAMLRTNAASRGRFFNWHDLESADYQTYIANLRDIGCPEQTIRDIIIADVNALYSKRLATEVATPSQQWWRSGVDTNLLEIAAEKARAIEEDRRTLLTRLLGQSWESGDLINLPRPSKSGVVLDGPVLGSLPNDVKQAVQSINARSQERLQQYVEAVRKEGRSPDPVELGKLRQQTRDDLARVLTPPQLEEFLLRYSQNANNLRTMLGTLEHFDATPDEFRALFRVTDQIDQRLEMLGDATDANSVLARRNLSQQRENAIKLALGARRYEDYQLLQDPLYRDAVARAIEAGTPEEARNFYAINLASAEQENSILSNTNLSLQQRRVELARAQLEALTAQGLASGQLPLEPPMPTNPPPRRTYTVRQGDSLAVVALIHGVPVNAIRAANPSVDFSRLKPGDALNIPRAALGPISSP